MGNVEYQTPRYVPQPYVRTSPMPWFIRLIFKLGITQNEKIANLITVVFVCFAIAASAMLLMRNQTIETDLPSDIQNIDQSQYANF